MPELKKIHVAHSPDADDAFMFYALAKGKIDTEGLEYEHVLQDIQTLNEWAAEGRMEVTAVSVHAYAYIKEHYDLLVHGGSIGENYGPMVVAKRKKPLEAFSTIAVPGKLTSAYLALRLRLPVFQEKIMPFDRILDAVAREEVEAGLLIHEGQLTYEQKGLHKIIDLGEWWYQETRLPLPMGVNAIRKDLPRDIQQKVSRHLRDSIAYALEHREEALDYALAFSRGLDRRVADRFVGMWVNERTLHVGESGRLGIQEFLRRGEKAGVIPPVGEVVFVE